MDFIRKNKGKIFVIFFQVLYLALSIFLLLNHENWRDEAQAWNIAKNLSIIDIFKQLKVEGHPCLWFLVLAPFAKLNLPYITLNIISLIIMNISVFLILTKSPFNKILKVIISFSVSFLYLTNTISRCYCLIVLLCVLIGIIFKDRKNKPIIYGTLIFLLVNTHLIIAGLCAMLTLDMFINIFKNKENRKKQIIGFAIACIGFLCVFFSIYNGFNNSGEIVAHASVNINFDIINLFSNITMNIQSLIIMWFGNVHYGKYLFLIVCLLLFINCYKNWFCGISILAGCSVPFLIHALSNTELLSTRAAIILMVIIFGFWIEKEENIKISEKNFKYIQIALGLFILIINIFESKEMMNDLKGNYSNAKITAKYISENFEEGTTFICNDEMFAVSIIPYLDEYNFWSWKQEKDFKFVNWGKNKNSNDSKFEEYIKKCFTKDENIYLLYDNNCMQSIFDDWINDQKIEKIYSNLENRSYWKEDFTIYKFTDLFWKE